MRSVRQVLLFWTFAIAAAAQSITLNLNLAKTRIEFTVGDVLHTVHGTFALKSGHFEVNPSAKTLAGEAVVDATTGNSGSVARDSRMKRNILEADRYPEILFAATGFTGTVSLSAPSSVTVAGWFSIHGEKHQVSVPMQVTLSGSELVATGHLVIPYVAWGMKNPSTFILRVSDKVDIDIAVVAPVPNLPGR